MNEVFIGKGLLDGVFSGGFLVVLPPEWKLGFLQGSGAVRRSLEGILSGKPRSSLDRS